MVYAIEEKRDQRCSTRVFAPWFITMNRECIDGDYAHGTNSLSAVGGMDINTERERERERWG